MMRTSSLNPNQTVAQVIEEHPETIPAWLALTKGCFGCRLMRFCSLQYVAESHNLELEKLLGELEKAIRRQTILPSGAQP